MNTLFSIIQPLVVLGVFTLAGAVPNVFGKTPMTRRDLNSTQIQRELGSLVSNQTIIFGPYDSRYVNATARWNDFSPPEVEIVIESGIESDVASIVSISKNRSAFKRIGSSCVDYLC